MRSRELESGDVVFRMSPILSFAQHPGVILKRNNKVYVIHLYGENKFNSNIIITTLKEFSDGKTVYVFTDFNIKVPPKEDIVNRALELYKDRPKVYKYLLGRNNCQHFVMRCLGYENTCPQEKFIDRLFTSISSWLLSCIMKESVVAATQTLLKTYGDSLLKVERFLDLGAHVPVTL